jgi:hypothetical protein
VWPDTRIQRENDHPSLQRVTKEGLRQKAKMQLGVVETDKIMMLYIATPRSIAVDLSALEPQQNWTVCW